MARKRTVSGGRKGAHVAPPRTYRHPDTGKFVSKADWLLAQRELRAREKEGRKPYKYNPKPTRPNAGIVPKKFRSTKRGKLPTRRGTKVGRAHTQSLEVLIARGRIPPPDFVQRANGYETSYWRFEGEESAETVRDLLLLIRFKYPNAKVRVSLGTGYGRNGSWIGTNFDAPEMASAYMDVWHMMPSGQRMSSLLTDSTEPVWYEVEMMRRVRGKSNRKNVHRATDKKSQPRARKSKKVAGKNRRVGSRKLPASKTVSRKPRNTRSGIKRTHQRKPKAQTPTRIPRKPPARKRKK